MLILRNNITSHVRLTLFNLIGEEVAVLIDGERSVGKYSYKFNSQDLASGFYFYRLRAGDMVRTKKLIFIR